MDGTRFDDLSRKMATGLSRRAAVKGAAAGLLGALGLRAAATAQVSQASCGNKSCKNNPGKCKSGCVCCVYGNGNTRCMPPGSCSGTPTCPPERPFVDPVLGCVACLNPSDCLQPSNPCEVATCTAGACGAGPAGAGASCGLDLICCEDACISNTTTTNCGPCGTVCQGGANATPACSAGACGLVCNASFADCDGSAANGCETSLLDNVANCGACGTVCGANEICLNGHCRFPIGTCPGVTNGAACGDDGIGRCDNGRCLRAVPDCNECGGDDGHIISAALPGVTFCVPFGGFISDTICENSAGCPPGQFCGGPLPGDGFKHCISGCPA